MPELRVRESLDSFADAARAACARVESRVGWRPFGPLGVPAKRPEPASVETAPAIPTYEVVG